MPSEHTGASSAGRVPLVRTRYTPPRTALRAALELAVNRSPIRLGLPPMALAWCRYLGRNRRITGLPAPRRWTSSGDGQVRPATSNRRIVNRAVEGTVPTAARSPGSASPPPTSIRSHRRTARPHRRHPGPPWKPEKGGPYGSQKRPCHQGNIISGRWARSFRNGGDIECPARL